MSISNAENVSKAILEQTLERVSATTIQRFFELISNSSKTSIKILDIFSVYVGFLSWEDFKLKNKEENPISSISNLIPDQYGKILFDICLKNHEFKSVIHYLDHLPPFYTDHHLLTDIGQSLGKVIRTDFKARTILLPELAKSKVGRFYFYENFVDIDYINEYYRQSISKYYLKHLKPNNVSQFNTDFVFAKSIEFIGLLKLNKHKEALLCSYILFKKINIEATPSHFLHPYPFSRLIAIDLISEWLKKRLTVSKIEHSIFRIESLISKENNFNATFILAQLMMALNFCSAYQEVIDLYKKYDVLIHNSIKTTDNYLPIMNCVKNSVLKLGIIEGLNIRSLDFIALENAVSAKQLNLLL